MKHTVQIKGNNDNSNDTLLGTLGLRRGVSSAVTPTTRPVQRTGGLSTTPPDLLEQWLPKASATALGSRRLSKLQGLLSHPQQETHQVLAVPAVPLASTWSICADGSLARPGSGGRGLVHGRPRTGLRLRSRRPKAAVRHPGATDSRLGSHILRPDG